MSFADDTDVDLPRSQTGSNPQHLVLGLLCDYWYGVDVPIPSAALVALLEEFGTTPTSARAAISRLARRGVLVASKEGRRTFYGLQAEAARALTATQRRTAEFAAGDRAWDGRWTVVAFSVPEDQRDLRYVIRTRLPWLGFAPLYDGVWISANPDVGQVVALFEQVAVASVTILRSSIAHWANEGDPLGAWDLEQVRARYDEFILEFTPLRDRVRRGRVGAAEALVARTRTKEFWWRELVGTDPDLPDELHPPRWPRREARALFAEIYDTLGPLAQHRVQQIVAEHDDSLAGRVTHLTTASVLLPE